MSKDYKNPLRYYLLIHNFSIGLLRTGREMSLLDIFDQSQLTEIVQYFLLEDRLLVGTFDMNVLKISWKKK